MHVDATTSIGSVTNQPSSICRTAIDALQAKYSAFILHSIAAASAASTGSASSNEETQNERDRELSSPNNTDRYITLLRSMTEFYIPRPKRQTALVNAGYKIRVACVLHHIEAFISFHQRWNSHSNTTAPVNIIIPGCGLDVTGLWSLSLHSEKSQHNNATSEVVGSTSSTRGSVHVIEIDLQSICESKAQALQSAPDLLPDELHLVEMIADDNENDTTDSSLKYSKMKVWQTRVKITQNTCHSAANMEPNCNKYSLISADLQEAAAMEEIFVSSKLIDRNIPTLILSELVLAYLSTKSSNDLLQQFATWFRDDGSCTILYEPLGPSFIPFLTSTSSNNMNSDVIDCDNQRNHGECNVDNESETGILSTLESYKNFYCNSFNDKLLKGNATTKSNNYEVASPKVLSSRHHHCQHQEQQQIHMFHPLGTSTGTVSERLKGLGFSVVDVAPVGVVASRLSSLSVQQSEWYSTTTELFDEHAAFVLHLSSYVVVCAFHNNVFDSRNNIHIDYTIIQNTSHPLRRQMDVALFRQVMCPWISNMGLFRRPRPISYRLHLNDSFTSHCGWITHVRKGDEKHVRQMFQGIYQQYFDQYPSIRKMVKSALRKDLGVANNENDERVDNKVHDTNRNFSTIATRYQKLGGDFLVAVQYNTKNDLADNVECALSETSIISESAVNMKETLDVPYKRHVLGCIGIRKSTNDECIAHSIPQLIAQQQQDEGKKNDSIFCYEINRFFVQEQYRKSGIGTMLWNTMLSSIITKCRKQQRSSQWSCNNSKNILYIIAITPTILESANSFYQKEGFMVHERNEIVDDLTMITYMKSIEL